MKEDRDEIKLYNKKFSNGLSIGLIKSDETVPIRRISAKLIIDGYKFTLTDSKPNIIVKLKSGKKNITLNNLTANLIGITVEGSSKNLELKEVEPISNNEVFIYSMSGSYPGTATVEGIIGEKILELDNKNPPKIVSLDSIDYLLELDSASDFDATIIVKTCDNSTAKIIEIADPVIDNETILTNLTSNVTLDGSSSTNDSTSPKQNQSTNSTNNNPDSISNDSDNLETKSVTYYFNIAFIGIIILIFIIIIIFILKYFRMKKEEEEEVVQ